MVEAPEPDPSETVGQMSLPTTHEGSDTATVTIDRAVQLVRRLRARVLNRQAARLRERQGGSGPGPALRLHGVAGSHVGLPDRCHTISGRDLSKDDIIELPAEEQASYEQLLALLEVAAPCDASATEYRAGMVERKILEAAVTSRWGSASEVGVLDGEGRQRQEYATRPWTGCAALVGASPAATRQAVHVVRGVPDVSRIRLPRDRTRTSRSRQKASTGSYDARSRWSSAPVSTTLPITIPASVAVVAAESLGLGSGMLGFAGTEPTTSRCGSAGASGEGAPRRGGRLRPPGGLSKHSVRRRSRRS
jgi:hypothetical protein